ncbi:MAG: Gldg family protein [Myxococcota bacterium]
MTGLPGLFAALGLVGVLFGILSLVLYLFGAPSDRGWIWGNLLIGVLLLAFAALANFDVLRERMSSGEARRAGRYGSSALLSTVLVIAILGLLGFLSTRYHVRFDWSEQKVHSLSSQSLKVLENLDRDVQALALYRSLDVAPIRELLDRYAYASERFSVEYADPNAKPHLLERYQITPQQLGEGLVRIALGEEAVEVQEVTEENITNAMVKLSRTTEKAVYFLQGHNERAIEGEAATEKDGFSRAADALRNENYRVEPLLLAATGQVPEDADVVIAPGATRPLLRAERVALKRYMEGGGALLVLLDPRAKTDLVDDVTAWGVDVGDDIIVDRQLALFGAPTTPITQSYDAQHEITRDMRDPTLFHVARSVRAGEDGSGGFTEIVFTGDSSWAERDLDRFFAEGRAQLDPEDLRGPVSIAVAGRPVLGEAEPDAGAADELAGVEATVIEEGDEAVVEPRLVVFGDSDFASNEFIEAYRNRDLFINSVNWLLGDVEAISIRPRRARASRFQLSNERLRTIRSLSLFVLPEAIAVVGVFVWWTRRQAPRRT